MNEIKLSNFKSISAVDLDRILRSLVSHKVNYDRCTKELTSYKETMCNGEDYDVRLPILRSIEETVHCEHASYIKRILSIIDDIQRYSDSE